MKAYVHIEDWRNRPLQGGRYPAVGEVFPEAKYQRCTVHFYRNVFSVTPRSKVKLVAKMLKAIHAHMSPRANIQSATERNEALSAAEESKKAARKKAKAVAEELRAMKLKEAAKVGQQEVHEYEALRGDPRRHPYCWLTSFSQSQQTNLRIIFDITLSADGIVTQQEKNSAIMPVEMPAIK